MGDMTGFVILGLLACVLSGLIGLKMILAK
ncbi:MAG: hypothetical protein HW389_2097 [Bacteroidetes bacterium]|nr:hypothetical protein [Bacteroidota bacterium]